LKYIQYYANIPNMDRYIGIAEAAGVMGVSITALRCWETEGKLEAEHTAGGHRRTTFSGYARNFIGLHRTPIDRLLHIPCVQL